VARKIHEAFASRVAFIDQDSYYRPLDHLSLEERREVNFDHPDAFDSDLLVAHVKALKAGQAIEKPVYDFVSSTRQPRTVTVRPAELILIEGILVMHMDALRSRLTRQALKTLAGWMRLASSAALARSASRPRAPHEST
jgi:uridine kinase